MYIPRIFVSYIPPTAYKMIHHNVWVYQALSKWLWNITFTAEIVTVQEHGQAHLETQWKSEDRIKHK